MSQMQSRDSETITFLRRRWVRSVRLTALVSVLMLSACRIASVTGDREASGGIRVRGPGVQPHIGFACCEHGVEQMQNLFGQPGLVGQLKELHADVAIPIVDFSAARTSVVRLLNREGVPVIAWIVLPKEQGYYLNADNAAQSAARIADFERWTHDSGLRWVAVGLDIEPDFAGLAQLRGHWWRMVTTLLGRSVDGGRIRRARKAYSMLIEQIRSHGYPVQIYQMPYVPAERSVHSSLPDRLLGTVDVRGDQDYVMLYTTYARHVGAGMIWFLGAHASGITIGITDGEGVPGTASGPLDWDEFLRDLIVASHFTPQIAIYDLEGCLRQGFLPRLVTMDWSQSVVIPAESVQRAARVGFIVRSVLWLASNLVYFASAGLLLIGWLLWRRFKRRKVSVSGHR